MGFVHLHCHSDHSLRDGFQSVEQMLSYASSLGQSAIALTDHGTMSGCGEGFRYANKYGIKFIAGCEHYLVPDVTIKDKFNQHIILLAMDKIGYRNLNIITTIAHSPDNFYFKPRIDLELLAKYNEGLICTTACLAGCQSKVAELKEIFGDRLYIELHTNSMQKQKEANMQWLHIANEYDVQFYAAVDAHYTLPEQGIYQRKWTGYLYEDDQNICFDSGRWVDQTGKEVHPYEVCDDFYMHSEEQVREALSYLPEDVVEIAIKNTQEVSDRCNFNPEMGNNYYPKSPYSSPKDEVRMRVWRGMKSKGLQKNQQHIEQVRHELNILEKVDYFDYFLIVSDMLNYCRDNGIRTGVGRGSVVGCDVAYLMGITKIDPIKNGLIFERFAHTERVTPADIDNDVPRSKRQDVIQYLKDTYGNVFQVVTFGKMGDKAAIRRTCDAFNLTVSEKEEISANPTLKENDEDFMNTVKQFAGKIQNFGTHASAVVVMTTDPYDFCAVERFSGSKGAQYNLNYDFHDLENMGLLKLDILGLETLDTIENTLEQIPEDERPDMDNLPDGDYDTYELLNSDRNCGLFQLEGSAVGMMMKRVKPQCIADLIAIVALGRPAPMQSGMSDRFIDVENTIVSWQEDFTKDTNGCIIYQEQVMALCQKVWGMTLGEADMIRRAVGRKDKQLMDKLVRDLSQRENFVGLNENQIKSLLDDLEKQSSYLFNKSHAAAYAYTAYQTAYLKAHYPLQFYTALLNSNIDQDKSLEYLSEIKGQYNVVYPDIIKSEYNWINDGKQLIAGFSYIKGVGSSEFEKPEWSGEAGLKDFLEKNPSLNKGVCINLVKAGCFDIDPQWGIDYVEWFKSANARKQECREKIMKYQFSKPRLAQEWIKKIQMVSEPPMLDNYNTPLDVVSRLQSEVLGMSNVDPFVNYDKSLLRGNNKLFLINKIDRFNDRNGNPMIKMYGQGQNGQMICIFWNPKGTLQAKLNYVTENEVIIVRTGQKKENNTYFCYDFVNANRVA